MKAPKTILAILNDKLCIMAKHCGIHPLIVLMDGFALYFYKRKGYLAVSDVIRWHESEAALRALSKRETENLDLLRKALADFQQNGVRDGQIYVGSR